MHWMLRGGLAALLVPLALLGAARPAAATQAIDGCTGVLEPDATTGVIVVDRPGVWCLSHDHVATLSSTNRRYIKIKASDVTLDCRGHRIDFAGGYNYPWAVDGYGQQRVTVRNCTVRGFNVGLAMGAPTLEQGDFLVEDNVIIGSDRAIEINGTRTIVRRNRLYDSGVDVPLVVSNGSAQVIDNLIDGVGDSPFVLWMNVYGHGEIRGNVIRNIPPGTDFSQNTNAIYVTQGDYAAVAPVWIRDNVLVGTQYNRAFSGGPEVRFANNIITGFTAVTNNGTDAGGNDVSP